MARYKSVVSNFSGGLVSQNLVGRVDIERTRSSLTEMTNFLPDLQGPMSYRPGTIINQNWRPPEVSKSVNLLLATNRSYQCIFFPNGLHIVRSDGKVMTSFVDANNNLVLDPIQTPYGLGALDDLRFSAETDVLYVTHGSYKPRRLFPGLSFNSAQLRSTEDSINQVYNDLLSQEVDADGNPAGNLNLYAEIEVTGDDIWTFEEIDFKREPFLDVDESGDEITASSIQRITKLESSFSSDFDQIANSATPTDWYVEYEVDNVWLLGRVITDGGVNYPEVTAPTLNGGFVYVEPVDSVVAIEDEAARLFLIDNNNNVGSGNGSDQDVLKRFGVPPGEIVVRSDVRIFSSNQEGSWIRIADDRRSNNLPIQNNRTLTRWQRIKEHKGVTKQATQFIRGQETISEDNYNAGDVYKFLRLDGASFDVKQINTSGAANQITAIIVSGLAGHTGVFTMYYEFHVRNHTTGRTPNSDDDGNVVANLSTVIEVDEVSCDTTVPTVEENTTLVTTTGQLTVTPIANEITLTSTGNTFEATDVDRHLLGTLSKNHVYFKIKRVNSASSAVAELLSPFPKNPVTNTLEDSGRLESFRLGAWYTDNYPRTVSKYESRRVYGGTYKQPNYVFFSKVGEELDFSPVETNKQVLDNNGISYPLSNINSSIRWIKSGTQLVIGTTGGVFRLLPNQFAASVSPTSIRIEMSDDEGCDSDGILVGSSVFFPDQSNSRLLEYNYEGSNGNFTNDVSKLLYPTFVNDSIKTIAYQHTPQPRLWMLTGSGKLYVLTYYKAENFYAWSKIDIEGDIKDICVMREGSSNDVDQLWLTRSSSERGLTHEYLDFSIHNYLDGATHGISSASNSGYGVHFFASHMEDLIGINSTAQLVTITGNDIVLGLQTVTDAFTEYSLTTYDQDSPLYRKYAHITAVDIPNNTVTIESSFDTSVLSEGDYMSLVDARGRPTVYDLHEQGDKLDLVVNGVYLGEYTVGTTMGEVYAVFVQGSELIEKGIVPAPAPGQPNLGNFPVTYSLGKRYTGKAKPMNPSYDISNGNVFGTEESRVVSCKSLIASGVSYEIGVNGTYQKVVLKTLTTNDQVPYSGFDKEKPLPNSMYGEDKIPEIRHSEPYPLTISALITKSDIHV